jgi:amino acid transporter
MPMLASFDFGSPDRLIGGLIAAAVLFVTWLYSAVLALVALALAFNRRTRPSSRGFAIASLKGSVPLGVFVALFFYLWPILSNAPDAGLPFLLLTFTPLIVGTVVFCFDRHFLREDGEKTHAV